MKKTTYLLFEQSSAKQNEVENYSFGIKLLDSAFSFTRRIKFFYLFILFLSFLSFPNQTHASDISLGIYPPIIQILATPPADIHSPMTLSNPTDQTITAKILVRPFSNAPEDNGQPAYLPGKSWLGEDKDIFQKMAIFDGEKNTDTITLAPHQQHNLELRVTLPKDEPASDYYFSITFLSNPIAISQGSNAKVAGGVSTNVLLSVGPTDKTAGFIQDFSTPFFKTTGPVPFSVHVSNTSHHFITPQGRILIYDMFGQLIGKVDLLPVNILATSSRFLPSDFNASTKATWQEKALLGWYSAKLTVALSNEGPVYHRTIYFFALPIPVIIGIILGIILIMVIVYRVRKRLHST